MAALGALALVLGLAPVGTAGAATDSAAPPVAQATGAGGFVGVTPYRLLDTRNAGGCVQQASPRRLQVAGVAGSGVPAGVAAVALNVTVVAPSIPGFLTVYPAGVSRPTASSLNYVAGQVIPNNVIVKTGTSDSIDIYASGGCPNVIVDIVGYFTSGSAVAGGFTGVTPYRIVDTRDTGGCVQQASPRRIQIGGVAGSNVPSGVAAVALNVTVVQPSIPGFLTVYPAGVTRPTASTLNYVAGQVIPNGTVVKLGTSDSIDVYASGGCPNVIVDVVGYFAAGTPTLGGAFAGVTPYRLMDTRNPGPLTGCVQQGSPRRLQVAGVAGSNVPAGVSAVALNVTVVQPSIPGFLTVYPAGVTRPTASTLNYVAGDVIPNGSLVKVGTSDSIDIYASGGCPNVIVDVVGYFLADTATQTLTVSKSGTGSGTVTSSPAGISCGATCSSSFADGSTVTLTASAAAGSTFTGWSGGGCSGTGTCQVTMSSAQSVTAAFSLNASQTLTVTKTGTGSGAVTSSPAGISCGATCAASFTTSSTVTLTATPDAGSTFGGWSGGGCSGTGTCQVTMSGPVSVSATFTSTAIVKTLQSFGSNGSGRLGDPSVLGGSLVPAQVGNLTTYTATSVGDDSACGLRGAAGSATLWCWGGNGFGQLGTGTTTTTGSPTQVGSATNWSSVSVGSGFACGTRGTLGAATLWCWGRNEFGQLGLGNTTNTSTPTQVGTDATYNMVSTGLDHTCAIRSTNQMYCWGDNSWGQLGDGTFDSATAPVRIASASTWALVGAGDAHTCARRAGGAIACWGDNSYGQLGDATFDPHETPANIDGGVTSWTNSVGSLAVGGNYTCARKNDGTLWCWGAGDMGQIGDGAGSDIEVPSQVGSDTDWAGGKVTAGEATTCAVKTGGTLWCWGDGTFGQTGVGNTDTQYDPVQVGTDTNWSGVDSGLSSTCALKTTGTLWCFGDNTNGQLGQPSWRSTPATIETAGVQGAAGAGSGCAVLDDGSLECWGSDQTSQLGDGQYVDSSTPIPVGTDTDWESVSVGGGIDLISGVGPAGHACAIKTGGTLWCWGYNELGQVGNGTVIGPVETPTKIGTDTDWKSVTAAAYQTCAIKDNGTLWCWGDNSYGQLGDGTINQHTTPNQVGTDTSWASVSLGYDHTCALKTNGTAWCWGANFWGQLGDNTQLPKRSPIQVGALTTWQTITAGYTTTCGTVADGTLYCWGFATTGLGDGATTSSKVPLQVGAGRTYTKVAAAPYVDDPDQAHTCAIATAGSLWCWGGNTYGQLGDGTVTARAVPTQVGSATSWADVSLGEYWTLGRRG